MIIKKGYRLTVRSWENDADNYKTATLAGLEINRLNLLVEVIKQMTPHCWDKNKYGNLLHCRRDERALDEFREFIANAVRERGGIEAIYGFDEGEVKDEVDEVAQIVWDDLYELALVGGSEHFATRVMERFTVEYVEQDIKLTDVTEQFK
jgi:hypothetical protein